MERAGLERQIREGAATEEVLARLEEVKDDIELVALELQLAGDQSMKPEDLKRLRDLRCKQLNRNRRKLNMKNPVPLSFEEAFSLNQLIPMFQASLSPLEQHRLREQLKRHGLFTAKEQELALLQEMRHKLRSTLPNQLQKKDLVALQRLLSKHA